MDGIDYSKQLSKHRQQYYDDLKGKEKAHNENISDLKTAHKYTVDKQSKNNFETREKLENDYKDRYAKMDKTQRDALAKKNEQYQNAISNEKENFHELTRKNLKQFNEKFTDLKTGFSRNLESTKNNDKSIRDQQRMNYEKQIGQIRNEADGDLKAYQNNAIGDNKEVNEKMQKEKRQLIGKHEQEISNLQKREIEKRNLLKDRVIRDVTKMRDAQETENIASRERARINFKKLKQDTDDKVARMQDQTDSNTKRLTEVQQKEIRKQNQGFSDRFTDQEKRYNHSLRELEIKNKINGIGVGSINHEVQTKKNDIKNDQVEKRISSILNERKGVEENYARKFELTKTDFEDTYRNMQLDHADEMEKQKRSMTEINQKARVEDRLMRERVNLENQTAIKFNDTANEKKLNEQRRLANHTVKNLKETFTKSMDKAIAESRHSFDLARTEMNKEKNGLAKRLHEQNSHMNSEIKEMQNDKLAKVESGFRKKVFDLEVKNSELKENLEATIQNSAARTQFEIERARNVIKKNAEIEINTLKETNNSKVADLRKQIDEIQKSYDSKMQKQRVDYNRKTKKQNLSTQMELVGQKTRYQNIIDQNQKFFQREMLRIKSASDSERDRLISQYEDKIKKLQDVNVKKLQEMEEFATLQKA